MKVSWTRLKSIISAIPRRDDLYLTLIDEEGVISSANMNMLKSFEIGDPRSVKTNFLNLVHPTHTSTFKKIIKQVEESKDAASVELYIKNGCYHPVKWTVNYLPQSSGSKRVYFCLGYTIIDNERLKKFNKLAEKHYQLLLQGPTGIIFHDKKGELIATNPQTATILHTTLERLYQVKDIKNQWQSWKIINECGEPVLFEETPFMKALKTGKVQDETIGIRYTNDQYRWIRFHSQPLPDDQQDDCNIISTISDVTNERILTAQLKEKEAVIRSFIKQTPHLAWIIDEDKRLILANDVFYNYFGLDEQTCLYKQIAELVPSFIYDALYRKHMEVLETGHQSQITEELKLADGNTYISHITIFPIAGADGKKLLGGYAVSQSDNSKMEMELIRVNERLLAVSRAASNAIWEWDMQTGTIYRNEALMEMIGYHSDDSKGLSWWLRRIHPQDRNRVGDKVKEATDNNRHSWQDEYRFKCADGTYKHVQDKGFVIYENGLPVKMIGSLQDISNLKELENKLADEKLKQQKEISETVISVQESERTKIGHELHDNVNQVLSTALLFLDMLNPSGKEQKQVKEKSVQYLKNAIEEIRKLSKELVVPQFKEQGLVNSIRTIIDDIHFTGAIRVKFTHDLESDLLSAGKKITLFRIVQEQLKNILNHSKAKRAEILLQTKEDHVQLIIKDDGIGFDAKQTHRGIGLSNIYERVSFYNGFVDIDTSPGKGCRVMVTLSLW